MKNSVIIGNKIIDYVLLVVLGFLALFLLSELAFSLSWRMQWDAPLFHYIAFLVDKYDYTPYKDVFDVNMPGTILFHLAIGKVFGYSDLAFRIIDVIWLAFLLGITWLLMRPFGKAVALAGPLLFGLVYLGYGPTMSLQRDYIGILPIALALLLATKNFTLKGANCRAFVIGGLIALSSSIKPHLAIGLPAVIIYISLNARSADCQGRALFLGLLKYGFLAALGFMSILSLPFIWLWKEGGIPSFWEMFSSYLPLYLHLTNTHRTISGLDRWLYLFNRYRLFGGMQLILMPTALGVYIAFSVLKKTPKIKFIVLLSTLLFLYSVYPVFSGQFWPYHWMPFTYFGCLCASLLLMPISRESPRLYRRVIPLIFFTLFLITSIHPAKDFVQQILGNKPAPPQQGKVDKIAGFLRSNLQPSDKVQPLDWIGGAVHAMLISEAVLATPYIYDVHFYHHISEPYIREIRWRFLQQLMKEMPRFIIDINGEPMPWGRDTTTEFPELQYFMDENYVVVYKDIGFKIFERKNMHWTQRFSRLYLELIRK